jgi:hypothetical protein
MKKLIMYIIIILSCIGCGDIYDIRFKVINDSSDTIHIAISQDDSIENSRHIRGGETNKKLIITRDILPYETDNLDIHGRKFWENFVRQSKDRQMRFFIIADDDFNNNSLQEIGDKQLYKKMKLSINDLKSKNFTIHIDSLMN